MNTQIFKEMSPLRKVFLTTNPTNLANRKCLISDICVREVCVVRGKYGFSEWTQDLTHIADNQVITN